MIELLSQRGGQSNRGGWGAGQQEPVFEIAQASVFVSGAMKLPFVVRGPGAATAFLCLVSRAMQCTKLLRSRLLADRSWQRRGKDVQARWE